MRVGACGGRLEIMTTTRSSAAGSDLDWGHEGRVPERTFAILLEALHDAEFITSAAAHGILEAFDQQGILLGEWSGGLAPPQCARLLVAIEAAFPNAARQLRFMISVILGERLKDAGALETLRRLRTAESAEARVDVAHGLQHLSTASPDGDVRDGALAGLREMLTDTDAGVRESVADFVSRAERGHAY